MTDNLPVTLIVTGIMRLKETETLKFVKILHCHYVITYYTAVLDQCSKLCLVTANISF